MDFYKPVKQLRLGIFASMKKIVKVSTNSKVFHFNVSWCASQFIQEAKPDFRETQRASRDFRKKIRFKL